MLKSKRGALYVTTRSLKVKGISQKKNESEKSRLVAVPAACLAAYGTTMSFAKTVPPCLLPNNEMLEE